MTTMRTRMPKFPLLLGLLLILLSPSGVFAQSTVEFKIDRREAWVGQPFPIKVEVVNAENHDPPLIGKTEGAEIQLLDQTNESSFTQIVNGRVTRRVTVVYTIVVTPLQAGTIEIPKIEVTADGKTYASKPWRIIATRSEAVATVTRRSSP